MSHTTPGTNVDRDEQAADTDDAAIIAECMDRMRISLSADSEFRTAALDDLGFLKGEQWDPRIKAQRAMDGRPCLTVNKLPVSLHQVTNAQRQNIPSIKVHPTSSGQKKLAEAVQGAIRHIEYQSAADVAKDTAVNSAAAVGRGYFRVVPQYVREDSFDQELAFKRIRNVFTVYPDPASVEVDGSDQQWCILSGKVPRVDFKMSYPKADPCDYTQVSGLGDRATDWADSTTVRIAEYYRIYKKPAKVVLLSNGESGYKDDLLEMPPGVTIVNERDSTKSEVQWFKLNATQILERTVIKCRWIPVFPVYGDEIDIDGKVMYSGMVRNAKDPARMYNYWVTAATEEIGMRPKAPFIGAKGFAEGMEDRWSQANVRNFSYLEYNPKVVGGVLAAPPQRQQMADVPVGVLAMAAHASDDIKSTTGIFDASLGARSNETSGVAINRRDKQGETANYHYTDNLNTTLRHTGRCLLDMIPHYYDGTRLLHIMAPDGAVSAVEINKPTQEPDANDPTQLVETIENDMSQVALFSATIGVGPSYETMRQEAVEGMLSTAQSWPKLMDIAGDKVIRSMDWPMSDDIADRVEKTIPPELRADEDENGTDKAQMIDTPNGPVPIEQVPQMLMQMQMQMQELQQLADNNMASIEKTKIQAASSERVAEINAVSKNDVAELNGLIQLLLQKMEPPPVLAAKALQTGENSSASTSSMPEQPTDEV